MRWTRPIKNGIPYCRLRKDTFYKRKQQQYSTIHHLFFIFIPVTSLSFSLGSSLQLMLRLSESHSKDPLYFCTISTSSLVQPKSDKSMNFFPYKLTVFIIVLLIWLLPPHFFPVGNHPYMSLTCSFTLFLPLFV